MVSFKGIPGFPFLISYGTHPAGGFFEGEL